MKNTFSIIFLAALLCFSALTASDEIICDFEEDFSSITGTTLKPEKDPDLVKQGEVSGRWDTPDKNKYLSFKKIPVDWSRFESLTFWMYSSRVSEIVFAINLFSDAEPVKNSPNYYSFRFTSDWEGWKQFTIPFRDFSRARSPAGWNNVHGMLIYVSAASKIEPDLMFALDDIRLISRQTIKQETGLHNLLPAPALTVYCVVKDSLKAAWTVNKNDRSRPENVLVRVYDHNEKIISWDYTAEMTPSADGQLIKKSLEFAKPGIYQLRFNCEFNNSMVSIDLPAGSQYGVCMQNGDYTAWENMPKTLYAWIPVKSEKLFIQGGSFELNTFGKKYSIVPGSKVNEIVIKKTSEIMELKISDPAFKFRAWGFPFILCNTRAAAQLIKASVIELSDGTAVQWKFQQRIDDILRRITDEKYSGKTENLLRDLSKSKNLMLSDPLRYSPLVANAGLLLPINAILRAQNLNPKSHWSGSVDMWKTHEKKTYPENRWDRLAPYGEKGDFYGGPSTKDTAAAAQKLALAAVLDDPVNPWRGMRQLLYRAAASALRDLMMLAESEVVFAFGSEKDPYPGLPAFPIGQKMFQTYEIAAPLLEPDIREVWTEALSHIFDRHFADPIVSCLNQSSHYLESYASYAEGSGDPVIKQRVKIFAARFLNNQSKAGWFGETGGPCASYTGITHWHLGLYCARTRDPDALAALGRSYRFFNHTVALEPDGTVLGGFNFGHRVTSGFYREQYFGAKGMLDNLVPEVAAWANPGDAAEKNRLQNAAALITNNLSDIPQTLEEFKAQAKSGPANNIPYSQYKYFTNVLPSVLPCLEKTPFIRLVQGEIAAVKTASYYAAVYVGTTSKKNGYPAEREKMRIVHPGEDKGGTVTKNQCYPMLGGGLTLFATPEYGSAITAVNFSPAAHHGLICFVDGKRWWADSETVQFTLNEKTRTLTVNGHIENLPLEYERIYIFGEDDINVTLTIKARKNIAVERIIENIPILSGPVKKDVRFTTSNNQTGSCLTLSGPIEKGVIVQFKGKQQLKLYSRGLGVDNFEIGRCEAELPANLGADESAVLTYKIAAY